jgi:hypothetical protein
MDLLGLILASILVAALIIGGGAFWFFSMLGAAYAEGNPQACAEMIRYGWIGLAVCWSIGAGVIYLMVRH